jgi:hypothetical protein
LFLFLAEIRAQRPDCSAMESKDVIAATLGIATYDLDHVIVGLDLCGAVADVLGPQVSFSEICYFWNGFFPSFFFV